MEILTPEVLNRKYHTHLLQQQQLILKIKPKSLADLLLRLIAPQQRRRILETNAGTRLYIDPFTQLGRKLILENKFEPKTVDIFRAEVKPGDVVLDIGANEGFFSVLSGVLVGDQGLVIVVEPQSRLRDLLEINLRLNNINHFKIFSKAIGQEEGTQSQLNLFPTMYTGQSSLVRTYKYTLFKEVETIEFIGLETIFKTCQINTIDFVKVDVEGFEYKVIQSLLPFIQAGKIKKLLLDYHTPFLLDINVNPDQIHQLLVQNNMVFDENIYGDVVKNLSSKQAYVLYHYHPS